MEWIAKDNRFSERVKESFNRQRFMQTINAVLDKVEPGFCQISIPYNIDFTQQHSFFHAGIVGAIADNTAGYAAYSLMDASSSILTVEFKLNLLAPADGELLTGKSYVLKHGKTLTICRSDVYIIKDGREKLCAASQSTLIELPNKTDF